MAEPGTERPAAGFLGAVSGMAATAVALLRTRLELATVEFEEERERIKLMLVLIVVATVFACFALVAVSVWVVVWFWDSHPLAAIAGVAIFHALIAGGAVLALKRKAQGRPFAATLAELGRDADAMRRTP